MIPNAEKIIIDNKEVVKIYLGETLIYQEKGSKTSDNASLGKTILDTTNLKKEAIEQ